MSYQVLARKWRPKNFKGMVGQEHILRMLGNALEQQRLHHAYLFTGTRGVGKTTIARILAKCLNCETGITNNPCGTCGICRAVDAGQFLDLYEIDAASRTKVEDTREILDNVLYPPTQGRYKIYLIDEVHMLSNHSFNALLKTLEEPPEHVKFLLATTDPKRLPITILSRCLQFHLKRIPQEQIANHLKHICTTENIAYDERALARLAKAADGSLRDALSLLDQAIAYGQGKVDSNEVNAMLGSMAQEDLLPLLQALADQNGNALFQTIQQLSQRAPDFQQLLEELISAFHAIAIAQIVPDANTAEAALLPFCQAFKPEEVQVYYQIALLGRRDLSLSPSPQQGFEMAMLRLLAFKPTLDEQPQPVQSATPAVKPATTPVKTVAPTPATPSAPTSTGADDWRNLLPKLELTGMAYALAANCTIDSMTDNKITLALSVSHEPMLNAKLKDRITEGLSRYFKKPMQLDVVISHAELNTPIKQEKAETDQRMNAARQTVMQEPKIKQLVEMYDATVEVALL